MSRKILTYTCANEDCKMQLLDLRAANLVNEVPAIDDITLCGGCGRPSAITLLGTRELNSEEFETLPAEVKADLLWSQRAVKKHIRNS